MFYAFTSWNWFSGYEFRMNSSFKTFIFSTEGCFMLCLIEIGPVFQEQKSFKMLTIILTVSLLSLSLDNGLVPHLYKLKSLDSNDA